MRREQHGHALDVAEVADESQQLANTLRIDVDGRFVEDQDRRPFDQRIGQPQSLSHAAGERAHTSIDHVSEPDLIEQVLDPFRCVRFAKAVEARRVPQVLASRRVVVEPDVVGQVADPTFHRQRVAPRVETIDTCRAAARLGQAEQHQDGGGLAGAVGAEQPEDLATADLQRQRVDGRAIAVALGEIAGLQGDRVPVGTGASAASVGVSAEGAVIARVIVDRGGGTATPTRGRRRR